jgi:hypothetical protein
MGDDQLHAVLEAIARLEGQLEGMDARICSLRDDYRSSMSDIRTATAGCLAHQQRTDALEQQMARISSGSRRSPSGEQRPATGGSHRAVSQRDLDESQRLVIAELEGRVERTVEERLAAVEVQQERRSENQRKKVRDWLEILRTAIMIAAAAGVGGTVALRCGTTAQSAQVSALKQEKLRRVLFAPDANLSTRR